MISHNELQFLEEEENEDIMKADMEDAINHGIIVSNLAYLLSCELGLDQDFCYSMAVAGMLHDIGKLKLSKYLYGRRKDTMVIEELNYVRMHATLGYDILKEKEYSEDIIEAIYHHHENYDGSGYPDNQKGTSIPLGARIIRACDVFAALISSRPYRKAFETEVAMELMIDEVKNFDMEVFLAFQRVINAKEFPQIQEFTATINKKSLDKTQVNYYNQG